MLAEISRKSKHQKMEALALQAQADIMLLKGDRQSSAKVLAAAVAIGQSLGDPDVEAPALSTLGLIAFWDHEYRRAIDHWQKYLEVVRRPAPPASAALSRQMEALGLGSLAACNKSPQQQAADNYEANVDNAADSMEANVANAADNMAASTDNAADAMKSAADNKSDAMKAAADNKSDAMTNTK